MSRRAVVVLAVLAVVAMGAGVASGVVAARRGDRHPVAADFPEAAAPDTSAPDTSAPATSTSASTVTPTTAPATTAAALVLQARVARRMEDGLLVAWTASAPVTAVLTWGFGSPQGNQLAIGGPVDHGTVKLPLPSTTRSATFQVSGRAADGRSAASPPASGRRLVRRVLLRVTALTLDIPTGTGGASTVFGGTRYTFGPGLAGPTVSSEPFAFPAKTVAFGADSAPLTVELTHQTGSSQTRTGTVTITVDYPEPGRVTTLTRDASAAGITAHLTLRVTVSLS